MLVVYAIHRRRLFRHAHVRFAMIYAVFVIGLNIFMGFAGQVSFGHNAFAAIGGLHLGRAHRDLQWPPLAALAVGLCGCG